MHWSTPLIVPQLPNWQLCWQRGAGIGVGVGVGVGGCGVVTPARKHLVADSINYEEVKTKIQSFGELNFSDYFSLNFLF